MQRAKTARLLQRGSLVLWLLLLSVECGRCSREGPQGHGAATSSSTREQAVARKAVLPDSSVQDNLVDTGALEKNSVLTANKRKSPGLPTVVEDMVGVHIYTAPLKYAESVGHDWKSSSRATAKPLSSSTVPLVSTPVVTSLLHYGDVGGHLGQPVPAGYSVVCVPPCDPHHPDFAVLGASCKGSTRSGPPDGLSYAWEAAAADGSAAFEPISRETPYAAVRQQVLDSMYLAIGCTVRCAVQEKGGSFGQRRTFSEPVVISDTKGLCPGEKGQGQDITATMEYLNETDHGMQSGQLSISVEIRHRDSMLPLVSTHPLPSAEQLFGNVVSQKQHVCSNVAAPEGRDFAFLMPPVAEAPDTGGARPFQSDPKMRGSRTVSLYRHLDLDQCLWRFSADISLKDAVGICGGVLLEDFKEKESHRRFVTARLPLYVTLAFPAVAAASGEAAPRWMSVERRSQLELTFAYEPTLWSERPLGTRGAPKAKVLVTRLSLDRDGRLAVHLLTKALFHGMLSLSHTTNKNARGRFFRPAAGNAGDYSLSLLWAEPSFDAPSQLWKAVSEHSLKDYSGPHVLELVPCVASPAQEYRTPPDDFCTSFDSLRFQVSVRAPQPINTTEGAVYSMPTEFQLLSRREDFLADPRELRYSHGDVDERRIFFKGETLFGRVLWNPLAELSASLRIDQVYLCSGKTGFTPAFNPTGHELAGRPSFGCVQPSPELEHRFLILDRSNPDNIQESVAGVSFKAKLADDDYQTSRLRDYPGVDGFSMLVDPLYEAASGGQWFLQVLYTVVPHVRSSTRLRRAVFPSNETAATEVHAFRIGHQPRMAGVAFARTVLASASTALFVLILGSWVAYRRHRSKTIATPVHAQRNRGCYTAVCGHLEDHHRHRHCSTSLAVWRVRVRPCTPQPDPIRPDVTEV